MALRFGCNRHLRTGAVLHVSGFFKSTCSNPEPRKNCFSISDEAVFTWQYLTSMTIKTSSMLSSLVDEDLTVETLIPFTVLSWQSKIRRIPTVFYRWVFRPFFHFQEQRLPTVVRPGLMQFKSAMEIVLHSDSSWYQILSVRLGLSQYSVPWPS